MPLENEDDGVLFDEEFDAELFEIVTQWERTSRVSRSNSRCRSPTSITGLHASAPVTVPATPAHIVDREIECLDTDKRMASKDAAMRTLFLSKHSQQHNQPPESTEQSRRDRKIPEPPEPEIFVLDMDS